jgi:hypothetical protein
MSGTDFINGLNVPIVILGYGPKRLFSVGDNCNRSMIPIFSNPEYARSYQKYYEDRNLNLYTYVVDNYAAMIELLEAVIISDPSITHTIIDPMPPTVVNKDEKVLCFELQEHIQKFRVCYQRAKKEKRKPRK